MSSTDDPHASSRSEPPGSQRRLTRLPSWGGRTTDLCPPTSALTVSAAAGDFYARMRSRVKARMAGPGFGRRGWSRSMLTHRAAAVSRRQPMVRRRTRPHLCCSSRSCRSRSLVQMQPSARPISRQWAPSRYRERGLPSPQRWLFVAVCVAFSLSLGRLFSFCAVPQTDGACRRLGASTFTCASQRFPSNHCPKTRDGPATQLLTNLQGKYGGSPKRCEAALAQTQSSADPGVGLGEIFPGPQQAHELVV